MSCPSQNGGSDHQAPIISVSTCHAHVAVRGRRAGKVIPGLHALVRAPIELAAAEVVVSDEWMHAEPAGGASS